jgi:hypothetical protein
VLKLRTSPDVTPYRVAVVEGIVLKSRSIHVVLGPRLLERVPRSRDRDLAVPQVQS